MKQKSVLTTGEVAKLCNVNFRTVIRWADKGLLQSYQLPGRGDRRIPVDEVIAFMKKNGIPLPKEFAPAQSKILIVDDDNDMATTINRILKRQKHETKIASNGFIAGSLIETFKPDLITLDLMMPGMNGFDIIEYIRSNLKFKHLKILVISGTSDDKLNKAIELGADDFLKKPFESDELIKKIQQIHQFVESM